MSAAPAGEAAQLVFAGGFAVVTLLSLVMMVTDSLRSRETDRKLFRVMVVALGVWVLGTIAWLIATALMGGFA